MKDLFLKLSKWIDSPYTGLVVLMVSAFFLLLAIIVEFIDPKQFNTLTLFVLLSLLFHYLYTITKQ